MLRRMTMGEPLYRYMYMSFWSSGVMSTSFHSLGCRFFLFYNYTYFY